MNGHFQRHSITNIPHTSFVLQLGHDGDVCSKALVDHVFTVALVDLNGINECRIRYCACESNWRENKAVQLLRAGFWPGSWKNPEIAFAIRVLKHFHYYPQVLYEFTDGLRRATNNPFPAEAPVRCYLVLVLVG
jgi:hypothetical protein